MTRLTREMNSEAVVGVDQYGSSHLFQDVQLRPYFVVNVVIAALCGLSTVTSLISLFAKKNWIADEFHRSIQIQGTFPFWMFLFFEGENHAMQCRD